MSTCDDLWADAGMPWKEGMLWVAEDALTDETHEGRYPESGLMNTSVFRNPRLDWHDMPTIGALLGLVREAWGDRGAYVRPEPWVLHDGPTAWVAVIEPGDWETNEDILDYPEDLQFKGATEAEALLRAYIAAKADHVQETTP